MSQLLSHFTAFFIIMVTETSIVAESRVDRDDIAFSREVAHRPRTVRERLGDVTVDRLLIMCRVDNDESLPATYHEWAACPCGVSERYVLQQAVDTLGL
jgi:hypothetical protein